MSINFVELPKDMTRKEGELEERCLEGDVTDQWQGLREWHSEKEENLEQLPGFLIDQILGC